MGDLEAVMAALRDLEASSDAPDPRLAIRSARVGDHQLAIMRSQVALLVRETLLVIFTTVCGMAALAFAWLLLRP
jgi:hypothetical protein